jgi:hypothetical protein
MRADSRARPLPTPLAEGLRLKRMPSPPTPRIVQLITRPAPRPDLVVEVGGARIHVGRGFDRELLVDVVSALSAEAAG